MYISVKYKKTNVTQSEFQCGFVCYLLGRKPANNSGWFHHFFSRVFPIFCVLIDFCWRKLYTVAIYFSLSTVYLCFPLFLSWPLWLLAGGRLEEGYGPLTTSGRNEFDTRQSLYVRYGRDSNTLFGPAICDKRKAELAALSSSESP